MKRNLVRSLGFVAALSLSALALQAQSGWTLYGCWSPYPNCVGAKDVYRDASGNLWQCRACGTTTNPSPSTCYQSNGITQIGYWCS